MEVSGQLHPTAALPPEKEPRYELERRLCGPQTVFGYSVWILYSIKMYVYVYVVYKRGLRDAEDTDSHEGHVHRTVGSLYFNEMVGATARYQQNVQPLFELLSQTL
jgi:hypothetical protein